MQDTIKQMAARMTLVEKGTQVETQELKNNLASLWEKNKSMELRLGQLMAEVEKITRNCPKCPQLWNQSESTPRVLF